MATIKRKGNVIFRRFRRCGGRLLDAHDYGYEAWPIYIGGGRRKRT